MQYGRPSSDIENPGGWTVEPLWEKIDEEPFNDGDFVESPKSAAGASFTIGLSGVTDPEVHTGHILRIRAYAKVAGTFKYELMQGAVVIKDSGEIALTTAFAEYNMTLSEAEAGNITDYSALRVRATAVTTQKNQYQYVSWMRMDVPDLAGEEHSGSAAISGNGSLVGTAKKGGKQSSLISAAGAIVAVGIVAMLGAAQISGGGTLAAIGQKAAQADAVVSGGGAVIASGTKAEGEPHSGSAVISGNGAVSALGEKGAEDIGAIPGGGEVSSSGEKAGEGTAKVTGNGSIIAVGTKQEAESHSGSAVISGGGIVSSEGEKGTEGSPTVSGNGALASIGKKETEGIGLIAGGGSISTTGAKQEGEAHYGSTVISGGGKLISTGTKLIWATGSQICKEKRELLLIGQREPFFILPKD